MEKEKNIERARKKINEKKAGAGKVEKGKKKKKEKVRMGESNSKKQRRHRRCGKDKTCGKRGGNK